MKIVFGLPSYDQKIHQSTIRVIHSALLDGLDSYVEASGSILPRVFNTLWSVALNLRKEGLTHFGILHADIGLEDGWLSQMMSLMNRVQADVMSVIIPIKSHEGVTSTALDTGDGQWNVKRMNLKDILPHQTFTHEKLLINTGVMLTDFRKPWVEKVHFRFEDTIIQNDGNFEARGMSEDWLFSRDAKLHGAKLYATNEIKAWHYGGGIFTNFIEA